MVGVFQRLSWRMEAWSRRAGELMKLLRWRSYQPRGRARASGQAVLHHAQIAHGSRAHPSHTHDASAKLRLDFHLTKMCMYKRMMTEASATQAAQSAAH